MRFHTITYLPNLSPFNSYSALLQCARNSLPSSCGRSSGKTKQRTAEVRGGQERVDNFLPASVEEGKKHGITDIDVLGATDYYKTPRGQKPHGASDQLTDHEHPARASGVKRSS
jgi:hypothetical protein